MTIHTRRIYLSLKETSVGCLIETDKDTAHYLGSVLRMKAGDKVRCFDGKTGEWLASIDKHNHKGTTLRLIKQLREQSDSPYLGLIYSPLKKEAISDLLRMATELGVTDFYPTIMERTNLRPVKETRLQTILIESAQQCERLDIPRVHEEEGLENRVADFDGKITVALERSSVSAEGKSRVLLIGPEGGFTEKEVKLFSESPKIEFISLGNNVLRAPTAACAGLSRLTS